MIDDVCDEIVSNRTVNTCVYEDVWGFDFFSDNSINPNKSITILSLNIRSCNKHFDELMLILNSYRNKFDVIILTETWMDESCVNVSMDGYERFVNKKRKNQNDGVIVFVCKCLDVTCDELILHGATCLKVELTFGSDKLSLLAVYRSPSSDLGTFIDELESYLDGRGGSCWLIGDVNCCILSETKEQLSQRYLDVMFGAGFTSCINIPTRVTEYSKSCIDHIFTNMKNISSVKSAIIKSEMTDHFFTVAQFQSCFNKNSRQTSTTNINSRLDMNAAFQLLSGWDWSEILNINDVDISCSIFIEQLQKILSLSNKTVRFSSNNCRIKPWMTAGLVRSIRTRDKLGRRLKKQPFNNVLKTRYKNYRNILSKTIRSAKEIYYRNKINQSKNNKRLLWNNIAEVMGIKKNKDKFPFEQFLRGKDDIRVEDIKQVANSLNEYYVGVGANLAGTVPPVSEPVLNDEEYRVNANFQLQPITENELTLIVNSLKGGSAPGIDNIPALFLKTCFQFLKVPLLHIFNNSIKNGVFPKSFKVGKVIPIYKGGPKDQCVSFRPITLASVMSKLLEKSIRIQLENYLIRYNILFKNQFGFRKDKNLNDDLFLLTKSIHNTIERNKKPILLFIDLAKAFDTVDRSLLLKKLDHIGVRGMEFDWFNSYLSDRYQIVSINGQDSTRKRIDYGVLQGSTLGPLLFLIFVNNLGRLNLDGGQIFLYADDTALLFEGSSWEESVRQAEMGLLAVKRWFDQSRLSVNLSKTKCMPISIRADCDPGNVELRLHSCGGQQGCVVCECVQIVSEYKYLGVVFDNRLKWNVHVSYLNGRLRKFIYIFSSLSKVLSPDLIKIVYYAYIQSLLQYGNLAWGGCYRSILSPLEITQKSIIKAALQKNSRFPTDLLFEEFKVLNISQLYLRTIISYIFKNKENLFNEITHSYSTRTALNIGFHPPRLFKTITSTSSHYIVYTVYSKLPPHIKNPHPCSYNTYKKCVNHWLLELGRDQVNSYFSSQYR